MTSTTCRHPWQAAAHTDASSTNSTTTLLPFTIAALVIGIPLLALSTIIKPDAPFVLATVLLGLALPALFLTHRESGGAAVLALLRDCVRLPTSWWWLPLAGSPSRWQHGRPGPPSAVPSSWTPGWSAST
jgi:hypothetical protein